LTPDEDSLTRLSNIPVVLVHADRRVYHRPVIANIVPNQERITTDLKRWLDLAHRDPRSRALGRKRPVVLVTLPEEGSAGSIRNERIRCVRDAIATSKRAIEFVDDFSFRHALKVFRAHPDAIFVCLSDEMAVAIEHLIVAGSGDPSNRVVGFDNSDLARLEDIPSFDQHLQECAHQAWHMLYNAVVMHNLEQNWPDFVQKELLPTQLVVRFCQDRPPVIGSADGAEEDR